MALDLNIYRENMEHIRLWKKIQKLLKKGEYDTINKKLMKKYLKSEPLSMSLYERLIEEDSNLSDKIENPKGKQSVIQEVLDILMKDYPS